MRTMAASSYARRFDTSLLFLLGCCCALPQSSAFVVRSASPLSPSEGIVGPRAQSAPAVSSSLFSVAPSIDLLVDPPLLCEGRPAAAQQQQQDQQQPWLTSTILTSSVRGDPTRGGDVRESLLGPGLVDLRPPLWALVKTAKVCGSMLAAFAAVRLIGAGWGGAAVSASSASPVSLPTAAAAAAASSSNSFRTGFYEAFALVSLSEIGDKSFFTAGLLAIRTSRLAAFVGSFGALAAMTLVSVGIGRAFHAARLPGSWSGLPLGGIATVAAFAFFGIRTLREASAMDYPAEEQEQELADAEADELVSGCGGDAAGRTSNRWSQVASAFALIFAAEFGDRSFLATVALASAQNPISVAWGATAAHALTTLTAVWGASYVAKHISEKTINYIGGLLFILFAFTTAFGIF